MKGNYSVLICALLVLISGHLTPAKAAQRDSTDMFRSGKALFNTHCASCHQVHREVIGPMLASITRKRKKEWLVSFIRSSQQVILSDDPYANFLFEQYNQVVMPAFKELSEQQINDLLVYIQEESENPNGEISYFPEVNQYYSDPEVMKGMKLFGEHCATCHFIGKDGIGPALGSVNHRRPLPWLIRFIENSQEVIQAGDPYAVHLFNSYDQMVMPPFTSLREEEILDILHFIDLAASSPTPVAGVNGRKLPSRVIPSPGSGDPLKISPDKQKVQWTTLKIVFIIISLAGALVHGFIIVKLYLYLSK